MYRRERKKFSMYKKRDPSFGIYMTSLVSSAVRPTFDEDACPSPPANRRALHVRRTSALTPPIKKPLRKGNSAQSIN